MPHQKPFRLRHILMMGCAILAADVMTGMARPAFAQAAVHNFTIPSQALADALRDFASQTGRDVLFAPSIVTGKRSQAVQGTMTETDALTALLVGTGLRFEITSANGYALQAASAEQSSAGSSQSEAPSETNNQSTADASREDADDQPATEKVVVTGSRIRGAKSASPVVTITQDQIRQSGHSNLGQAVRALPQNFSGGQNPGVAPGATAGNIANQNQTGSSAPNLRGLGPDATLTLLNGARLPYDGFRQATDVSVIPVAAIDRIEVLLDGASAIYGSDAVGGVVNVILKRDYDGAELTARYGTSSDGGYEQRQLTALAGTTWETGGFLLAMDSSDDSPIRVRDRDFLGYIPLQNTTLYPSLGQQGALFSSHQDIGSFAEIAVDAFYSERNMHALWGNPPVGAQIDAYEADTVIWGVAPTLSFFLTDDWSLRIQGFSGADESEAHTLRTNAVSGALLAEFRNCSCHQADALSLGVEGSLLDLPAGEARVSLGGGRRENEFEYINLLTNTVTTGGKSRSTFAYGEIYVPLVSADMHIPAIERLSLNGAVRYESYNRFGDVATPKVGALWGVSPELDLKFSWGRSFKAPTLSEQFEATTLILYPASLFDPSAPAGSTLMYFAGGNPELRPEEAETLAVGFVTRPSVLDGLQLEFSYFELDYTDRVVFPLSGATALDLLTDPAFSQFFVTFSPNLAQQSDTLAAANFFFNFGNPDFTPAPFPAGNVYALLDARYTNAAVQHTEGVDLSARYVTELLDGELTATGGASWLYSTRQLTPRSEELRASGAVFFPPEFRGRIGATWRRNGLSLTSNINYIGEVANLRVTPAAKGDAMVTADLVIDYQTQAGILGDIGFNLAVINLFNEEPPFMQPANSNFVNYDSTNYSAIGRTVSLAITKRF